MKTEVHFQSAAFNCTEVRSYFINPGCWGDDLCQWMIANMRSRGVETDEDPGQEDFGWYFCFDCGGASYCFVVAFQPNDPDSGDHWIGWIERDASLIGTLFGARRRGIKVEAVTAIDQTLRSHPEIAHITWHDRAA